MSPLLATTELPQALNVPLNPFWIGVIAIGLIVVGVSGAIGAINGFLTLVARFKQTPPLHEKYATKVEMHEIEARTDQKLKEHHAAISKDLKSLMHEGQQREARLHQHIASADKYKESQNTELKSVHEQLGRIFGKLEEMGKTRRAS